MGTDTKLLRRRAVVSSLLGVSFATAVGGANRARADQPEFQELTNPAVLARRPTSAYLIAGAVAGKRLLAGGEHGLILYSDDQGQSWHQAAVPVSTAITDIAFATDKIGWATGGFGVVMNTADGGQSWTKQLDGNSEITLMNQATQAFIATQPPDSDAVTHLTRRDGILSSQGPDKPFLSLLAISPAEVFAFGTYRFAEHSIDGGKTWADWSLKIGDPGGVSRNIYGAANLYGALYLAAETGLIYKSTDGGQSFPQIAQPGNASFFGICDAGKGNILAFGVAGQIFLSTDDGKTWNAPDFSGSDNLNCGALLPSGDLILGDNGGGVWRSKDNGQSFKQITHNPGISSNAVVPIDGLRFLIISNIGVIPFDLSTMQG